MKFVLKQDPARSLDRLLAEAGCDLDLRCGGNGTCGRCRVKLLAGACSVPGRERAAPATVLACQARIVSETVEVEVPESSRPHGGGNILAAWESDGLPVLDEPVVAVDVGTTTLVAVKILRGEVVARASAYNPQHVFGDNVIARIHAASTGHLDTLSRMLVDGIGALLDEIGLAGVNRIALAGNTVMSCLFHHIDPASIGVLPFTPPTRVFPDRRDLYGGRCVSTVPAISGYVGGDLSAGLAIMDLHPGEMLIDIGTNCEIIYATADGVICAAAAAGPAFEGAGLACGCRAVDGAIDHVFPDDSFSSIGARAPVGVCGSGYVDFLAVHHASGRINEVGRYAPPAEAIPIVGGVVVTEADVAQLLKAKAAVWAGVQTLEAHGGGTARKIYLAGGFAHHLDLHNARAIQMLPDRNYEIVGNTSLAGAARLACDPGFMTTLLATIDRPREIPLNTISSFEDAFIDGLLLP